MAETILLLAAAAALPVHASLLLWLGSLQRGSRHPALRLLLWAVSAAYFPLMSYVLSELTGYIRTTGDAVLVITVVLIQFLRAKADMAALTVGAVTAPAAPGSGDGDGKGLKILPGLVYSVWVAGLVIYSVIRFHPLHHGKHSIGEIKYAMNLEIFAQAVLLWALGGCRIVLKIAAFLKARSSFAHGRNALLIQGHVAQLHQELEEQQQQLSAAAAAPPVPPRLIVTGEPDSSDGVEPRPEGYRVKVDKDPVAQGQGSNSKSKSKSSKLVTLDQVTSLCDELFEGKRALCQRSKDLCLSMALFKCLRRRFARLPLAEAGSSWALRFVLNGLPLDYHQDKDDPEEQAATAGGSNSNDKRVFRVIADELSLASDFYYSPLPLASLGATSAALHFLLSVLITALFCSVVVTLTLRLAGALISKTFSSPSTWLALLGVALAVINAGAEIWQMVVGVQSNWTKVSIICHIIRFRRSVCAHKIFVCLLGCKPKGLWKDEIRQVDLPTMTPNLPCWRYIRSYKHLFGRGNKKTHRKAVEIKGDVKAAILTALRRSEGHLSNGTAAVRGWCQRLALRHDHLSCACLGGSEVTTATEAILVWHIATSLFHTSSRDDGGRRASEDDDDPPAAVRLSRYCAYLVGEARELLPGDTAWAKHLYDEVTESIRKVSQDKTSMEAQAPQEEALYEKLIRRFSEEDCNVLKQGSALAKQLVGEARARGEDAVWELLKEFWAEMLLYLAPSDNVKGHMWALQRGGELITLLWALLLHAGITSRPDSKEAEP